jgi:hypothetical protein
MHGLTSDECVVSSCVFVNIYKQPSMYANRVCTQEALLLVFIDLDVQVNVSE